PWRTTSGCTATASMTGTSFARPWPRPVCSMSTRLRSHLSPSRLTLMILSRALSKSQHRTPQPGRLLRPHRRNLARHLNQCNAAARAAVIRRDAEMAYQPAPLGAVERAIARGERIVRYRGRSVEYRSVGGPNRARDLIRTELAQSAGPRSRVVRLYHGG